MSSLRNQLRWLIAIRLVVITSVVLPYFLLQLKDGVEAAGYDFLYLLAGCTYVASLVYIGLLRLLEENAPLQAYCQFVGDLLLITGLVYYFGGIASPFSILYLIVISVAATLLRRRAGAAVATVAWALYASTVMGLFFGWLPATEAGGEELVSVWRLTYNLAIHLFGFYAVALLISYLAESASRAERELEEKREDLADLQTVHRDIIESISSGLITTDLDGVVVSINRAGQELLDLRPEDLVGKHVHQTGIFTPERWRQLALGNRSDLPVRDEVECRRRDRVQYIGFSLTPLTNAEDAHIGHIVIFQDLTHWRALQEELRIKDRMAAVGELAAGIAHEIGNPLAAISGSVQMLSVSLAESSPSSKLLDIILKESERLNRTIKGFLQFARPKERSNVRFDIAKLLAENFELLRNSQEVSRGHRLEVDLDPPETTLIADPDQVSQIFWNLARNALRAMPDGGALRVTGKLDGDSYRIRFTDTGHGMSEGERTRIFHPFQSFFDGGTGIGMAIVYRIVQEHGGRLSVNSRQGEGTTITVELPVARSTDALVPMEASS